MLPRPPPTAFALRATTPSAVISFAAVVPFSPLQLRNRTACEALLNVLPAIVGFFVPHALMPE